ncbi:MAG: hypothetical protein J1F22_04750 [Lachnospiraceae bacterium]|nr:hypothetical protein [Lachnospiraceae bacterium]
MALSEHIQIKKGTAFPLGVTKKGNNQVQITIWCPQAADCNLRLYRAGKRLDKIKMYSMRKEGMEDIFSVLLSGENVWEELNGLEYDFVSGGEQIQDIYAKAVVGRERFGKKKGKVRARFVFDEFDWGGERWKRLKKNEMVLYQCHVRGFTRHSSSGVKAPGTFSGMREKIPYLKKLGINTLLLLPVYEFNEYMEEVNEKGEKKINYWGYAEEAFYFAPKAGYATPGENPCKDFQQLVYDLHRNGMNLILDMYFVGQTPEFILHCLRYYALHFHVDGFRINQDCMNMDWLYNDPVLSHVMLLGNSWAEHPERVGRERLFEMNDGFLVDARRYLKSDEGQVEKFYHRFREQRQGIGVIHYITQNNGFTLRDLISYDVKHNEANGEKNQDGTEYNYSWNCGVEGTTRRKPVLRMRDKQEKNALVMLLLGMAVPMLLAGDEFGNSQKGNNNAYCQDNLTTWLDWRLLEKNKETFAFVKQLLAFRKKHPLYHQLNNLMGIDRNGMGAPDVSCHGREPWVIDFSYYSRELGILYCGSYFESTSLYFAFNFHWDDHDFFLPNVNGKQEWTVVLDTSGGDKKELHRGEYKLAPRSIVVFESVCNRSDKTDRKTN